MHPRRYTREEMAMMYDLAKARDIDADSMRWSEFIMHLEMRAPDILRPREIQSRPSHTLMRVRQLSANVTLLFDGDRLHWQQDGNATSWPAYSGTKEYWQSKNFSIDAQKAKDKGPIPEGYYRAPQDRYQEYDLNDTWDWIKGLIWRGNWPGGTPSWGLQRVWLTPESTTDTYGRDGFSIHGGDEPGSIGCIDLVENMLYFVILFRRYGKDVSLYVEYKIGYKLKHYEGC